MSGVDLLHDETAELGRLSEQVAALVAQNAALVAENASHRARAGVYAVQEQVWAWFRDGGPDGEDARDAAAGGVCRAFLSPGSVAPGLVTAAAVTLVESQPSGLSDAEVVSAAMACRQVITHAELTQARLTRELAWRYQARHPEELDLGVGVDARLPDWVRDPEQRALAAAIEEVAALARTSPTGLRARVEMIATWAEDHPVLHRALHEGTLTTGRARLIARESEKLPGARERAWVETRILPYAEQVGEVGLRTRLERLIAQADPTRYRALLDDLAQERDTVTTRQQGYGRAALSYQGSIASVAALRAALIAKAAAANPATRGQGTAAADQRATTMADVLYDLITAPTTTHTGPASDTSETTAGAETDQATGAAVAGPVAVRVEPQVCMNMTLPYQVLAALWTGKATPTAFGLIDLHGHGPIPARTLATLLADYGKHAIWRTHILDDRPGSPTLGAIIGIGRAATDPGYTPSPSITALVRARSHHCTYPGCRRPATTCDLDHLTAYTNGGTTTEDNQHPLCRYHHLLKHHTGFTPHLHPHTGTITWHTPSGHQMNEPPDHPPPLATDGHLPDAAHAWPPPPF